MADPRLVDRLAANATAPGSVERLGGWQLQADATLPFRRSNATVPLPDGDGFDVEARIDAVEAFYRERGLPARFQITPSSDPADLDDRLARRGYTIDAPVDILVADIAEVLATRREASSGMSGRTDDALDLRWAEDFDDEPVGFDRIEAYGRVVAARAGAGIVAMVDFNDEAVAVGFGVVESGWLGVFGMATRTAWRRRGAAGMVLQSLAGHASTRGATCSYLQVEVDNPTARRLYESAGYVRNHGYHYLVASV
jgi:GNAT superfamily N-acetyltransferase